MFWWFTDGFHWAWEGLDLHQTKEMERSTSTNQTQVTPHQTVGKADKIFVRVSSSTFSETFWCANRLSLMFLMKRRNKWFWIFRRTIENPFFPWQRDRSTFSTKPSRRQVRRHFPTSCRYVSVRQLAGSCLEWVWNGLTWDWSELEWAWSEFGVSWSERRIPRLLQHERCRDARGGARGGME